MAKIADPLAELITRVDELGSSTGDQRETRRRALAGFVDGLSAAQRKRIVRGWRKLPRKRAQRLHGVLCRQYNTAFDGPVSRLLREIHGDLDAWVDSLPEPPPIGPPQRTADEWTAILVRDGWPEDKARDQAAKLARPRAPYMTAEDLEYMHRRFAPPGTPALDPEVLRQQEERSRRGAKWYAATDGVAAARVAEKKLEVEEKLREACPQIARYADAVSRELGALAVGASSGPVAVAAATLRDGLMGDLAVAIAKAAPKSGVIFNLVQREHPGASGDPAQWDDAAYAARELAHAMAEGAVLDGNRIIQAASDVFAIVKQARSWSTDLKRSARRPSSPAVDAAVELKKRKLKPAQIATVLDHVGLHLKSHTPGGIRKAVWARRPESIVRAAERRPKPSKK